MSVRSQRGSQVLRRAGSVRGRTHLGRNQAAAALVGGLLLAVAGGAGGREARTEAGEGGWRAGGAARSEVVAAANPHAARAGARVLAAGGGAIDAAIATQLVLNLVEPQSSGIGGGAFLLHYEAATGEAPDL